MKIGVPYLALGIGLLTGTSAEQPRNNGIGYELFLSQFDKEKEAK